MIEFFKKMMGHGGYKNKPFSNTKTIINNSASGHIKYKDGELSINGMSISGNFSGRNIQVLNGKILIDGHDVTPDTKTITIEIHGNVENLDSGSCQSVTINGSAGPIKGGSGNIQCGTVNGNVTVGSGKVDCGDVIGDVDTGSGNVHAKTIKGLVKTGSGNIRYENR